MHDHPARPSTTAPQDEAAPTADARSTGASHGHSMWAMVACCAPMVLIAVALLLGLFGTR